MMEVSYKPVETIRTLYGQRMALEELLKMLSREHPPHAIILAGEEGCGKASTAYCMTKVLLANAAKDCKIETDQKGIRSQLNLPIAAQNSSHTPKIEHGAHPNLFILKRLENPKTKKLYQNIRVEEVRDMIGFLQSTPAEGSHRVVIVDSIDDMNLSAANAMLKMLEEPPKATTFFLIAHRFGMVMPTIRSRCQHVMFSRLNAFDMASILRDRLEEGGEEIDLETGDLWTTKDVIWRANPNFQALVNDIETLMQTSLNSNTPKTAPKLAKIAQTIIKLNPERAATTRMLKTLITTTAVKIAKANPGNPNVVGTLDQVQHSLNTLEQDLEYNIDFEASVINALAYFSRTG